jgi:hypothetical protein
VVPGWIGNIRICGLYRLPVAQGQPLNRPFYWQSKILYRQSDRLKMKARRLCLVADSFLTPGRESTIT